MRSPLSNAELLARLVAFDTVSDRSNRPIVDFICDYLDDPRIHKLRLPDATGTKDNLYAWIAPDGPPVDGAGLLLSGHVDVVPANEPEWTTNPFELAETADAYVARGACDMKGFVALAINALLESCWRPPRAPLALLLTYDEETGTYGAQHFAEGWQRQAPLPRAVIVGEPTSLRAVRMHKGHLKMRATFRGRTAHSAYPQLGCSAIEPAARVVTALAGLNQRWTGMRNAASVHYPETPSPNLNIGRIRGGDAINVVPDWCTVELGVRLMPGMTPDEFERQVRDVVRETAGDAAHTIESLGTSPALLLGDDAPVYRSLCELLGQRDTIAVSYATDGGPLATLGLDCVVWGPGDIAVAHKPNERLPKAELARAAELLGSMIHSFCVAANG